MSNIPKLRFPEFSGEWEEKRLDSLSLINPKPGDLPEVFSYIDLESVKNGVLLQEKIIKKEEAPSRAQRLLEEKDILFQTVRPYQRNNYFFNSKSPTVASTGYAQFRVNKNNYPSFLYQYLYTNNFVKNVLDRCSGTSFPAISTNDLLEICLHIPSLPEQQKIADFLSNVDSIITAETKILNALQKKKKALMQKLFTRQLRFKSDDGTDFPAWEEKKLGDVCSVLSGKRVPKGNKLTSVNTGLKYITVSDMGDKFVSNKDIKYITQEIETKIKKYKVITGDIIISVAGTLGKVNIITEEFNNANLTENCDKLTEFKGCITEYLFYFLQSEKFLDEINRIKTSSAQPKLALDRLRIFVIPIPIIEEQQKIADCLSSIDSLIQTQQKVVTTWQQRKKALLQQMFV